MTQKSSSTRLLLSALVLFAVNVLNFYDRHVPGALTEPIRKEFHLTDTQIGLLGSAFIWIYALVGLPLGRIADSASRKKLLAVAILIWSSLTASAAFAGSFTMLLFSRIGVGIGEAGCAPAATSWLGDLFPPDKRSRVLALFMLGVPVGGALSFFFSGPLAQAYGWRAAMILAAAPALLLVPALLLLPEPKRGASEISPAPLAPSSMWTILRIPTLWWIIASGALLNFSLYAISTFLPAFLSRVHGLSLASSGTASGIVYITGGLTGCALAGYLGDAAIRRRKDGRLRIAALTSLAAAPLACLGLLRTTAHRPPQRFPRPPRRRASRLRRCHRSPSGRRPPASHADHSRFISGSGGGPFCGLPHHGHRRRATRTSRRQRRSRRRLATFASSPRPSFAQNL